MVASVHTLQPAEQAKQDLSVYKANPVLQAVQVAAAALHVEQLASEQTAQVLSVLRSKPVLHLVAPTSEQVVAFG